VRLRELERKYVSEVVRRNGGTVVFIINLVFAKQIEVKVRF
jgi:hypothetical protein